MNTDVRDDGHGYEVERRLLAWGAARRADAPPIEVAVEHHPRPRGDRRWLASAAAAVVILSLAGGVLAFQPGHQDHVDPSRLPASVARQLSQPVPSGQAHTLIFGNGDVVEGAGEIQATGGKPVRFCSSVGPPISTDKVGAPGGSNRQPPFCFGVNARGVDLSRLTGRFTQNGTTYGAAVLRGVYRNGTLSVTAQGPSSRTGGSDSKYAGLDSIPCSPPVGGWAIAQPAPSPGISNPYIDFKPAARYRDAHPGTILKFENIPVSKDQAVALIVTTSNPATVQAALNPYYRNALCVVRSRYSQAQLTQTIANLTPLEDANGSQGSLTDITSFGNGEASFAPDGQLCVTISTAIMTKHVAAVIDAQEPGIVQVSTFLRPA